MFREHKKHEIVSFSCYHESRPWFAYGVRVVAEHAHRSHMGDDVNDGLAPENLVAFSRVFVVPEPTTWGLLGMAALASLGQWRRSRRLNSIVARFGAHDPI